MSDLFLRIEPRTRTDDLTPGLIAAVHDPAWLLARQWVMGEFDGEDAGTPVQVRATLRTHELADLELRGGQRVRLDPAGPPLDTMIEREPGFSAKRWTMRRRIDAGRELVHQLREAGLSALIGDVVREYPLTVPMEEEVRLDPNAVVLASVAVGRLPDGQACYDDPKAPYLMLSRLQLHDTDVLSLRPVLKTWRLWLASVQAEPEKDHDTWNPARFEHRARLLAPSWSHALIAESERGGRIGWSSFDAVMGAPSAPAPAPVTITTLPTPVRFRGMPLARFFEMEDAGIDLGAVDASAADLARMALLEFALVYANDMFMVPVRLPIGTVTEVERLEVKDNFGMVISINSATRPPNVGMPGWSFLAPQTPSGGRLKALVLPHVAGHPLVGPVIEDVRLMRDEMANLVWAIEHSTEGGDGRAQRRAETAPPASEQVPSTSAALAYRLMTAAPPHWFPLVLETDLPRQLRLALLDPSTETPRGRLLPAVGGLVYEEEVPREGVRLLRERVLARSSNGSTYLWTRRRRMVGRGEGSSGLEFDMAETKP
ncbi:hypothetical protein ACYX34_08895 [Nitrospira sp. CMX1]